MNEIAQVRETLARPFRILGEFLTELLKKPKLTFSNDDFFGIPEEASLSRERLETLKSSN